MTNLLILEENLLGYVLIFFSVILIINILIIYREAMRVRVKYLKVERYYDSMNKKRRWIARMRNLATYIKRS